MGALDEGHYDVELSNGVNLGELGFEDEPEILAIEEAVKLLLQGLGEDSNREGLKKTPLRVAKALREGTRGDFLFIISLDLHWFIHYSSSLICCFQAACGVFN